MKKLPTDYEGFRGWATDALEALSDRYAAMLADRRLSKVGQRRWYWIGQVLKERQEQPQ